MADTPPSLADGRYRAPHPVGPSPPPNTQNPSTPLLVFSCDCTYVHYPLRPPTPSSHAVTLSIRVSLQQSGGKFQLKKFKFCLFCMRAGLISPLTEFPVQHNNFQCLQSLVMTTLLVIMNSESVISITISHHGK